MPQPSTYVQTPEMRYNSGYRDAVNAHRNHIQPRWKKGEHFDSVYERGYWAGIEAAEDGAILSSELSPYLLVDKPMASMVKFPGQYTVADASGYHPGSFSAVEDADGYTIMGPHYPGITIWGQGTTLEEATEEALAYANTLDG